VIEHFKLGSRRDADFPYLGWLGGHFDSSLQNGDWESGTGIGAEPEPEVRVWRLVLELLLQQLVQLRHPT